MKLLTMGLLGVALMVFVFFLLMLSCTTGLTCSAPKLEMGSDFECQDAGGFCAPSCAHGEIEDVSCSLGEYCCIVLDS